MTLLDPPVPHDRTMPLAPDESQNELPERARARWMGLVERHGLLGLLVVLMVIFSFVSEQFLTSTNLRVVLGNRAPLCLLALAVVIPLVAGQFDFSVGAVMGVSSIVTATAMSRFDAPLFVAIALALAAGALIGVANGLVISKIASNSFIVTLGASILLQGVVQWYTGGNSIVTGISHTLIDGAAGNFGGIPKGLIWLVPVAIATWYVLEHTPFGRYLASIGSNPSAARLVGLRVDRFVVATFVLSGTVAALAGVLVTAQTGTGDPQTTLGALLLPAFAAAFLGCSAFRPGRFNVAGTLLAVYFVAFTVSGLEFAGAAAWVEPVFNGLTLIGAVSISAVLARRQARA